MKKFNLVYGLLMVMFLSGCEEPLSAEEIKIRSANISNVSWWKSATTEMLKKEIDNKADVNFKDRYGESPLSMAINECKGIETVKLLIENGAEVNFKKDDKSPTPLIEFFYNNCQNFDVVKYLVDEGAKVNETWRGMTPLMYAISTNADLVEFLIKNDADVNWSNGRETALSIAMDASKPEIVGILLKHGAKVNEDAGRLPLIIALTNTKMLEVLLENGADVNAVDSRGFTGLLALMVEPRYSFNDNFEQIVEILLDKGADTNIGSKGDFPTTPLGAAVGGQKTSIIELLIRHNADVNKRTSYNSSDYLATPLIIAVRENRVDVVELLLKNNADVNKTDSLGNTALGWATYLSNGAGFNPEITKIIENYNASNVWNRRW